MKPFDHMRPPIDRHLSPFCNQTWMVIFGLCNGSYSVRELQRIYKILEFKAAPEMLNTFFFDDLPLGDLELILLQLPGSDDRFRAPAGNTPGFQQPGQLYHLLMCWLKKT